MPSMRDTIAGLFLEVSIVEHLARTRVEKKFSGDLELGQFGILGYLIRNDVGAHSVSSIAWTFQEEEARVDRQVRSLAERGLIELTSGLNSSDSVATINDSGRITHEAALTRMGPDFTQIVAEISPDDLATAHRVLHEIRLVMDNLPDR